LGVLVFGVEEEAVHVEEAGADGGESCFSLVSWLSVVRHWGRRRRGGTCSVLLDGAMLRRM
jgi:hypothetical protein